MRCARWVVTAGLALAVGATAGAMPAAEEPVGGAAAEPSPTAAAGRLDDGTAVCQTAPEVDEDELKRRQALKEQRVSEAVRKARAGKSTVVKVGALRIGIRELTCATLETTAGRREVVVPSFQDATKKWTPEADVLKGLKRVPRGFYEVIHTEEKYGIEWVVGVGKDSPTTLAELESRARGRRWQPARRTPDPDKKVETVTGTATGRFIEVTSGKLEGKSVRALVVERGLQMKRTTFYLVRWRRGVVAGADTKLVSAAAELKSDDTVEVDYIQAGTRYFATAIRKK